MPQPNAPIRVASNLSGEQFATLSSALTLPTAKAAYDAADLIVIEARPGHDELKEDQAAAISERVRLGATLLVTLGPAPNLSAMRLGAILPAITWQYAGTHADPQAVGGILAASADAEFFPQLKLEGRSLAHFSTIQPISAAERGQSRNAYLKHRIFALNRMVEPGDDFWTRPLLLRDVCVRLRGNDNAATPLLATARYGAGRTALFASDFEQLTAAPSLLPPILAWLKPDSLTASTSPTVPPELTIEYSSRSIILSLTSKSAMTVEVVGRACTWENAPLGLEHDLYRTVTLTPGRPARIEMPFPAPASTNFQALSYRDAFRVRLAVLGSSGAEKLLERQFLADFSPPVALDIRTDDIDHWQYPFHSPGLTFQPHFEERMGASICAYAYPPGAKVESRITLANGLRDLSALATVRDLTTPENPSAACLLDGAMVLNKRPLDEMDGYSMWTGKLGVENTLSFTFPHPVTIAAITLVGNWKPPADGNPDAASIQLDGRRIASGGNLAQRFVQESGNVRFDFEPATGTVITVALTASSATPSNRRTPVALTEVQFEGWTGRPPAPSTGQLVVTLEDALSGASTPVLSRAVSLKSGERLQIAAPFALPHGTDAPSLYRLAASFNGARQTTPVLSLTPAHPLLPYADLVPPDAPSIGLIVTNGYRFAIPLGTGTAERVPGAWAFPDDMVWAYSRQMKEVSRAARTQANRLYVTEGDMQHYAAPWRTFLNGIPFYEEATPNFVAAMARERHWNDSNVVHLSHSDRWDTGPQIGTLHGWQDFVEFDAHLRASGKPGLRGKTRADITNEIHQDHEDEWQNWQLGQYMHNLRTVREGFAAKQKRLLITAQGVPVIAGAAGSEVGETVQAMSDDSTWGMAEASVTLTTGRQMAELAFNPVWKMSTLHNYGYVSSILNNPEWRSPTGTLEPTRRHYYDRAWRATVWPDDRYGSVYTAGFNPNAGLAYQMTQNDWIEWWRMGERNSLIMPEEPLGAGLVISTIRFADPAHIRFTTGNIFEASIDGLGLARVFQRLHDAGLSLPFSANATALANWQGNAPLIILNPEVFSDDELATLEILKKRGVRMAAFSVEPTLSARIAALFQEPGALIPIAPASLTSLQATQLAPTLHKLLQPPLQLPTNVSGYGFKMSGTHFVVVEDWQDTGRTTQFRLRATPSKTSAQACEVNEHTTLPVRRDGDSWVVDLPLRPGDAQLVALRES